MSQCAGQLQLRHAKINAGVSEDSDEADNLRPDDSLTFSEQQH